MLLEGRVLGFKVLDSTAHPQMFWFKFSTSSACFFMNFYASSSLESAEKQKADASPSDELGPY